MDDVAERIFELVDKYFEEQKAFALAIGVSPSKVSQWRMGITKSYTKKLSMIANVLNTSTEYLLTGKGTKTKASASEAEKNSNAATPEGSGIADEFARIFVQLTPENQNKIIAEMLKRQRNQ